MVKKIDRHRFVDKTRVRAAIETAERETSAPIYVSIAPYFWGDVRRTAERAFRKHGLGKAPQHNAVLFFVVPSRRQFAIIGGAGAHEAVGQALWDSTAALLQDHFGRDDATAGLVAGIEAIGRALAARFPL